MSVWEAIQLLFLSSFPPPSCHPSRVLGTASGVLHDRRFLKNSTVALVTLWLSYAVWDEATLCVPDFVHSTDGVPGPPTPPTQAEMWPRESWSRSHLRAVARPGPEPTCGTVGGPVSTLSTPPPRPCTQCAERREAGSQSSDRLIQ